MANTNLSSVDGSFVGRVWVPELGPILVVLRGEEVFDITSHEVPTMRDLLELDNPASYVIGVTSQRLANLSDLEDESITAQSDPAKQHLLAPNDLQSVKASGVTFARSMVERVIEERAAGDPQAAKAIRSRIGDLIGSSLSNITPGSDEAEKSSKP